MKKTCVGTSCSVADDITTGEHEPLKGVCIIGAEVGFDYKQDAVWVTKSLPLLVCKHCGCVYVSIPEVGEADE
jgi:hypothetical protein